MYFLCHVVFGCARRHHSPTDLEVAPDVGHAALDKDLPRLLLERGPAHIQGMHVRQVIDAADVHPVPRADLHNNHNNNKNSNLGVRTPEKIHVGQANLGPNIV